MSISKNLSIRRKAASLNNTRSAYLRKQIEFELSAYCKSEARGFPGTSSITGVQPGIKTTFLPKEIDDEFDD